MDGGFRSVEYKLTKANNIGIRNWKDGDNTIKSAEYKLTEENNLGLRNFKDKNKANDTKVLPKSNTISPQKVVSKEIATTKASPPPVERKQAVQKPNQPAATVAKATPIPQKPPQIQPKSSVTNGNNDVRPEATISKTSMSPTDRKIPPQSPKTIPASKEEARQPAKTTDVIAQSSERTPRENPEFYIDPQTGKRYPNYQRPQHAWQTPYPVRPRFEWQISEPMRSPRFLPQTFPPQNYLSMMDPLSYPMQNQMMMMNAPVVMRPAPNTQMYGPHASPLYPQYSYNMR